MDLESALSIAGPVLSAAKFAIHPARVGELATSVNVISNVASAMGGIGGLSW